LRSLEDLWGLFNDFVPTTNDDKTKRSFANIQPGIKPKKETIPENLVMQSTKTLLNEDFNRTKGSQHSSIPRHQWWIASQEIPWQWTMTHLVTNGLLAENAGNSKCDNPTIRMAKSLKTHRKYHSPQLQKLVIWKDSQKSYISYIS